MSHPPTVKYAFTEDELLVMLLDEAKKREEMRTPILEAIDAVFIKDPNGFIQLSVAFKAIMEYLMPGSTFRIQGITSHKEIKVATKILDGKKMGLKRMMHYGRLSFRGITWRAAGGTPTRVPPKQCISDDGGGDALVASPRPDPC